MCFRGSELSSRCPFPAFICNYSMQGWVGTPCAQNLLSLLFSCGSHCCSCPSATFVVDYILKYLHLLTTAIFCCFCSHCCFCPHFSTLLVLHFVLLSLKASSLSLSLVMTSLFCKEFHEKFNISCFDEKFRSLGFR